MVRKKESPAGKQGQSKNQDKNTHPDRHSKYSGTQCDAYLATAELRATEIRKGRVFFLNHPNKAFSRADVCDELRLPINHVTRIVCNLLDEEHIEVFGRRINPRSGRTVQVLKLKPRKQEPTLFDVEVNRGKL